MIPSLPASSKLVTIAITTGDTMDIGEDIMATTTKVIGVDIMGTKENVAKYNERLKKKPICNKIKAITKTVKS